ncbi:hypothetical protein MRX96_027065 [Rhipicephalus microplus]
MTAMKTKPAVGAFVENAASWSRRLRHDTTTPDGHSHAVFERYVATVTGCRGRSDQNGAEDQDKLQLAGTTVRRNGNFYL